MRKNRLYQFLLFILVWMISACSESDLILSRQQAVVVGNVLVEADKSEMAVQKQMESLDYYSVELVGIVNNPDDVEINSYGILVSKTPDFSISQCTEYVGENLGKLEKFAANNYSVKLQGLEDATTYYYRFFVKHAKGVSYSAHLEANTFTTKKHERAPETIVMTKDFVEELKVECAIIHDGHYEITECGMYLGKTEDNLGIKIKASEVPAIVAHKAEYVVEIADYGLKVGDVFFCQPYAVNKIGEGKGNVMSLKVEKMKAYARMAITSSEVHRDKVKLSIQFESLGNGPVTEYGYYNVLAGEKVKMGDNIESEQTFVWDFNDLKMGEKHVIYLYAINADGETPAPEVDDYYSFMAGIPGKNEDDKNLVYLELPPIEKNGKKYYFLDRNLGAINAYDTGVSPGTPEELGWLFQSGRKADGHQLWDSPSQSINKAFSSVAEAEQFVSDINQAYPEGWQKSRFLANSGDPWTWLDISSDDYAKLWTDEENGGLNNPCPEGYHVPTNEELNILIENKDKMKLGANFRWRAASGSGIKDDGLGYFWGAMTSKDSKYGAMKISNDIGQPGSIVTPSGGQGCYIRPVRVE